MDFVPFDDKRRARKQFIRKVSAFDFGYDGQTETTAKRSQRILFVWNHFGIYSGAKTAETQKSDIKFVEIFVVLWNGAFSRSKDHLRR